MPITIGNRPNFGAAFDVINRGIELFTAVTGMATPEPKMLGESAIEWERHRSSGEWAKSLIVNLEWRDSSLVIYTIQEAVLRLDEVFHIEPVQHELRARQLEKFKPDMVRNALLATGEHLTMMFEGFQKVYNQYQVESEDNARRADAGEFRYKVIDLLNGGSDPFQEPPEEVV